MDKAVNAFTDAYHRIGKQIEVGENLSVGFHFHIADSVEKAVSEVGEFYEENLKMFGPLRLVRALTDEQIDIMSNPHLAPNADLPNAEDAVKAGGILAGPPEIIIEKLKDLEEKYPGLNRVSVSHPVGTPQAVITEQLQMFAEQVMPEFSK